MWIVLLDTVYVSIFHIVTVTVIAIVLTKLQLQLQQSYSYVLLSVQKKKSSWRTSLVISMNKEATFKCHRETQKHKEVKIGGKKHFGEKKRPS